MLFIKLLNIIRFFVLCQGVPKRNRTDVVVDGLFAVSSSADRGIWYRVPFIPLNQTSSLKKIPFGLCEFFSGDCLYVRFFCNGLFSWTGRDRKILLLARNNLHRNSWYAILFFKMKLWSKTFSNCYFLINIDIFNPRKWLLTFWKNVNYSAENLTHALPNTCIVQL